YINDRAVEGAYPLGFFQRIIEEAFHPEIKSASPVLPVRPGEIHFDEADLKGHPFMGPVNAPITIVEFGDFHCPFCKKSNVTLQQLMEKYPGKIRRVWR